MKGKERMSKPAPQSLETEDTQNESADSILARQIALNASQPSLRKAAIVTPQHQPPAPGAAQTSTPAPTTAAATAAAAALRAPPTQPAAPTPPRAPATAVVDKSLWIYVSNAQLPGRRRGWQASNTSWRN